METIRVTTSQNIDIDYEVAGLGERIVARIIDYALFILILILALITISSIGINMGRLTTIILIVIYSSLFVFYDLICEAFIGGQSIGKRIMKIKVISLDGAQPSFGQYLMRWVFRIVDFLLTSNLCALISVAVSENRQRLGDIVAGTTLIKTEQRVKMSHISFMPQTEEYEPIFAEATQLSEKDVALIQDVINTYVKTQNATVVYTMANRVKEHLGVTPPSHMNDLKFLQTVIKDYGYLSIQAENI